MEFNCDDCVFAIVKNDKQIGCQANRLEKLDAKMTWCDGCYYTLSRFCNLKRLAQWAEKQQGDWLKLALIEVMPPIRCAVLYTTNDTIGQLKHTLQSLINTKYNKLEIVIVERKSEGLAIIETINLCKTQLTEFKWSVDQCVDHTSTIEHQTYKALKKNKSGYYTIIEAGLSIKQKYFQNLNHLLNEECEPILFIAPEDNTLIFTVQSFLYRMLQPDSFTNLKEMLHDTVIKQQSVNNNSQS